MISHSEFETHKITWLNNHPQPSKLQTNNLPQYNQEGVILSTCLRLWGFPLTPKLRLQTKIFVNARSIRPSNSKNSKRQQP